MRFSHWDEFELLFLDVRIARFGDAFEARTLPCSSLQCLLNPSDILASKGTHLPVSFFGCCC